MSFPFSFIAGMPEEDLCSECPFLNDKSAQFIVDFIVEKNIYFKENIF